MIHPSLRFSSHKSFQPPGVACQQETIQQIPVTQCSPLADSGLENACLEKPHVGTLGKSVVTAFDGRVLTATGCSVGIGALE